MAASQRASDLVEALVGGPEIDAGNKGRGQEMGIDVADALPHELAGFDKITDFSVEAGGRVGEVAQILKRGFPLREISAGEFAKNEGVRGHLTIG